jgi:hypothetical protein
MKIEQMNSWRLFGEFGPRAPESVPEGLKFLAKVTLTTLIPAIAFSWTMSSTFLFMCLIAQQVLGVGCGFLLYKQPDDRPLSVVFVGVTPTVPAQQLKQAA